MGSGALVLVWSHPQAFAKTFHLMLSSRVQDPNDLPLRGPPIDDGRNSAFRLNQYKAFDWTHEHRRLNTTRKNAETAGGAEKKLARIWCANQGHPSMPPIIVLLSPDHA